MYNEFLALRSEYLFRTRFNGQACYLQSILNIRFDPELKRIHVVDAFEPKNYLYERGGASPKRYLYGRWNSAFSYQSGQKAVVNRLVYRCLQANSGINPVDSVRNADGNWTLHHLPITTLRRRYLHEPLMRYVVYVPTPELVTTLFHSVLDYYRFSGLKYQIFVYP